ncbi:tail assembly protein [Salmonella enterica]|nr:tail assembly protein [Salmonella enterica]
MVRICLYGDLQRFGKRISLSIKTAAEGIHALAIQLPGFLLGDALYAGMEWPQDDLHPGPPLR